MKWVRTNNNYRHPKIYTNRFEEPRDFYFSGKTIWLIFFLLLIGGLCWFLFKSSYFKVKNIQIVGTLNQSVKSEIESFKGKNILFLGFGNITKELEKKQTSIEHLKIYRGLPDCLKVEVDVRRPKISWKSNDKVYYVDENGIIFSLTNDNDLTDEEKKQLIIINDTKTLPVAEGTQILTSSFIDFVSAINEKFEQSTGAKTTEYKIGETTFQVQVQTDKNFYVLFDTTRDFDVQLNGLKKVILEKMPEVKEYVDMRVEGKAYYK